MLMNRLHMDGCHQLKLKAYYFLIFGALGGFFPYLPIFLERYGWSDSKISYLLLLFPVAGIFAPPLWGALSDRLNRPTAILRITTIGSVIGLFLMGLSTKFSPLLAAMALFCLFRSPLSSLADALTHHCLEHRYERYSTIRLWGSLGFISITVLMGQLNAPAHSRILFGLNSAIYLLAFLSIPSLKPKREQTQTKKIRWKKILKANWIFLLLGTGCYYLGHSIFDGYFGLHLTRIGQHTQAVGWLWAIGVGCEVLLMLVAPKIFSLFSSSALLVLAGLGATLRWYLLIHLRRLIFLAFAQSLHAISFGLWYLALVRYIQDRSQDEERASFSGIMMTAIGIGQLLGYLSAGRLLEQNLHFHLSFFAAIGATLFYLFAKYMHETEIS